MIRGENTNSLARMLRTCQSKCIPDEYGEAELNKGETVCVDRCVKKFFKANLAMGRVSFQDDCSWKTRDY